MKVKEKILMDMKGLYENGPINIVIFGDSVSHGAVVDNIDYENVYWNLLKRRLNAFRDFIPVNMICAAIGGTTAEASLSRFEKHALSHSPDLVIACFGLNDVNGPLDVYLSSLRKIFDACISAEVDIIFMTPNMLNTYVAEDTPKKYYEYAGKAAEMQNGGRMDEFMSAACALAREMGVTVCDCYAKWKKLAETEDITMLLANRINHPISEMHSLFADSLYDVIMGDTTEARESDSTMYRSK